MAHEYRHKRRVEFSDTDMAGIVHYANFFRYMESAEHAFYRSLGFSVVLNDREPPLGFPRVHAECDYKKPLRFGDEMEIHLIVKEKRSKVLQYLFRFYKLGSAGPELVAQGGLTIVCVAHQPGGTMAAAAIPSEMADLIEVAPPDLLQSA